MPRYGQTKEEGASKSSGKGDSLAASELNLQMHGTYSKSGTLCGSDYSSSENQLESNGMILTLDSYGCGSCWGVDGESGANVMGKLPLCPPDCRLNAIPLAAKPAASWVVVVEIECQ